MIVIPFSTFIISTTMQNENIVGVAVNRMGQPLPILTPDTTPTSVDIDGTSAHAESGKLAEGIYRLAVVSSSAGVRIAIGAAPVASTSYGVYLADQQFEYYFIPADSKVSVLGGILNIIRFS
jgi:hypothetical protein